MRDNLLFQNYLVVFVDLLGQRDALRRITGIPTTEPEKLQFIETAKESIGKVLEIRDAFKQYYDSVNKDIYGDIIVSHEYRDEIRKAITRAPASYYGLSDAMVLAVPLMSTDDENCAALHGIHDAFLAILWNWLIITFISYPDAWRLRCRCCNSN
jgi:hypothetical protein